MCVRLVTLSKLDQTRCWTFSSWWQLRYSGDILWQSTHLADIGDFLALGNLLVAAHAVPEVGDCKDAVRALNCFAQGLLVVYVSL